MRVLKGSTIKIYYYYDQFSIYVAPDDTATCTPSKWFYKDYSSYKVYTKIFYT